LNVACPRCGCSFSAGGGAHVRPGNGMRRRRVELGLTLEQMSLRLGYCPGTISRWERRQLAPRRIDLVAAAYGVTVEQAGKWFAGEVA
jgi:transcriptional regulator with XRE-family HTH domain